MAFDEKEICFLFRSKLYINEHHLNVKFTRIYQIVHCFVVRERERESVCVREKWTISIELLLSEEFIGSLVH